MSGVAGRSGPPGNQNATRAKRWQQAIDRALAKRCKGDGIAALDALAEKYLDAVEAGAKDFIPGFSSLGDRLDGKPAQAITGPEGGPIQIERVEVVIVDPAQ